MRGNLTSTRSSGLPLVSKSLRPSPPKVILRINGVTCCVLVTVAWWRGASSFGGVSTTLMVGPWRGSERPASKKINCDARHADAPGNEGAEQVRPGNSNDVTHNISRYVFLSATRCSVL